MNEYNDRFDQIKIYLTDVINDIMLKEADKGYIRITKEDSERYAHMSIAIGKFYYFDPLQKIYFYFTFDKNVRWAMSDQVRRFYKCVMDYIYEQCRNDINCTISLLGPAYLIEDSVCAKGSNISKFITPYTVGYWKGTNDLYEFINDPELELINKHKYDFDNKIYDTGRSSRPYLKQLKDKRDELNKEYNFVYNPDKIPEGFAKYRTAYNNIMGINLPNIDYEEDSFIIRLLNATDFFGGTNYYN